MAAFPQRSRGSEFGDLISQKIASEEETFYHHYDGLGSTAVLTDALGVATDEYDYEAFGKTAAESGPTPNPYKWVGRLGYRYDEETDLYDVRRRKYAPDAGRFLSEDPVRDQEENLYRYVGNQPTQRVDPSGLDERRLPIWPPPIIPDKPPGTISIQGPGFTIPIPHPANAFCAGKGLSYLGCIREMLSAKRRTPGGTTCWDEVRYFDVLLADLNNNRRDAPPYQYYNVPPYHSGDIIQWWEDQKDPEKREHRHKSLQNDLLEQRNRLALDCYRQDQDRKPQVANAPQCVNDDGEMFCEDSAPVETLCECGNPGSSQRDLIQFKKQGDHCWAEVWEYDGDFGPITGAKRHVSDVAIDCNMPPHDRDILCEELAKLVRLKSLAQVQGGIQAGINVGAEAIYFALPGGTILSLAEILANPAEYKDVALVLVGIGVTAVAARWLYRRCRGGKKTPRIKGPFGHLTQEEIDNLIRSSGSNVISVYTKQTAKPDKCRQLFTATERVVAEAARDGGILYVGRIPKHLYEGLESIGLIRVSVIEMGGTRGREIIFEAEAMDILWQFFR